MGRAQVLQAQACGVTPNVVMNLILLKPEADCRSQVICSGRYGKGRNPKLEIICSLPANISSCYYRTRGSMFLKSLVSTNIHGIGMVLVLPRATTILGPPPNINCPTCREPGNGAGMASPHGSTVVEVARFRAGAHIEPVLRVLT